MKKSSKFVLALSTMLASTIGVGIFSLPYITVQVGLWVMLGYLVAMAGIILVINLFFSEIALQTPDFLRFPGFCQVHLGKIGKLISTVIMIVGSMGAILAFIIIGGGFLTSLLSPVFGGSTLLYTFIYFGFGAFYIFWGLKVITRIDLIGIVLFLMSLLLIAWRGAGFFNVSNLPFDLASAGALFLPFGPLLFALWSSSLIPEIEEVLEGDKRDIKKVVTLGTLIPAVCYLVFIVMVVLVSGDLTSTDALSGLKNILGQDAVGIIFFAGLITSFTCFITIGVNLKEILWYDIKIPKNISWILACLPPMLLYAIGFKSFIGTVSFIGGIALALQGVLILLMYRKIKNARFKFLIYPLLLVFAIGIIYEIIYLT